MVTTHLAEIFNNYFHDLQVSHLTVERGEYKTKNAGIFNKKILRFQPKQLRFYTNRVGKLNCFKWINQHLRIKSFFCTFENAVKSQIWIAVSVYVHIAIIRKRLHIEENLHTILQILSLTMFEKMPLKQLLNTSTRPVPAISKNKKLNLFSFLWT